MATEPGATTGAGPTDAELEAAVAWVWALGDPLDPLSPLSNHQCALAALLEWYLTKRALLANVIRLVECEWQDDVPLARLYTLRQALGLTTDYPIDQDMWEADIARNRALLDAALSYGAAHAARLAEGRRLRAANYQGNTAEGAAYSALLIAEAEAQDALYAAYAAYVGAAGEEGAGGR